MSKQKWRINALDASGTVVMSWDVKAKEQTQGSGRDWSWSLRARTKDQSCPTSTAITHLELVNPDGDVVGEKLRFPLWVTSTDSLRITWNKAQRVIEEAGGVVTVELA